MDVAFGRRADLQESRREQPESTGDRAFGVTRYRLISAQAEIPLGAKFKSIRPAATALL